MQLLVDGFEMLIEGVVFGKLVIVDFVVLGVRCEVGVYGDVVWNFVDVYEVEFDVGEQGGFVCVVLQGVFDLFDVVVEYVGVDLVLQFGVGFVFDYMNGIDVLIYEFFECLQELVVIEGDVFEYGLYYVGVCGLK